MEIFLKSSRKSNFTGFHPWVLERALVEPTCQPESGQIVDLVNVQGKWIGRGVYNPNSRIRVRLYQWQDQSPLDDPWLFLKLEQAYQRRQPMLSKVGPLGSVRWVNSEGDGLSGLVVEQYNDFLMVQATALAVVQWREQIVDWLVRKFDPKGILWRVDTATGKLEGIQQQEEIVHGQFPEERIQIQDGHVTLSLDLLKGQKTGYYLDQRKNRQLAANWIGDGPLLDVCCYLGGFSLAAHKVSQPSDIVAVDSSAEILRQAEINADLNGARIDFVQADCFDFLKQLENDNRRFHSVVLDPPRMASRRNQVSGALRAYHRLNLSAVNLLEPGGVLVTCSCSGRVSRADLMGVLASVSQRTRRSIHIMENLAADFDHPILAHCPESEYLKCFICQVD